MEDNNHNNKPSNSKNYPNKHKHCRKPKTPQPSGDKAQTPENETKGKSQYEKASGNRPKHRYNNNRNAKPNNGKSRNQRKNQPNDAPQPHQTAEKHLTCDQDPLFTEISNSDSQPQTNIPPEVIFLDEPDESSYVTEDFGVKVGDPDFSLFDFDTDKSEKANDPEDPDAVEVIGVRFRKCGKVYYFDPVGTVFEQGQHVIVETARGSEYGEVWIPNRKVSENKIVQPLRPIVRTATEQDAEHHMHNRQKEKEAFSVCREKIEKHGLDMKLVEAQYTFDNSKLLFYFTSAGRVDFRELVKDLASVFRTRIELRQIGIRDEAKMLGGLGACGRPLCCSKFLSDFAQVSIKMAKDQNLSLNSNKISGCCGRLMCCLRFENDTYEEEIKKTPPVDSIVKTADGNGVITEINPLAGLVKVRINDKQDTPVFKMYRREDVTVISSPQTVGEKDVPPVSE